MTPAERQEAWLSGWRAHQKQIPEERGLLGADLRASLITIANSTTIIAEQMMVVTRLLREKASGVEAYHSLIEQKLFEDAWAPWVKSGYKCQEKTLSDIQFGFQIARGRKPRC